MPGRSPLSRFGEGSGPLARDLNKPKYCFLTHAEDFSGFR